MLHWRLQGDRPYSCGRFEMRLTSVRPSVQKLWAFQNKNASLCAHSRALVDFSAKILRTVHRKCTCQHFPACPITNTLHSTIFLDLDFNSPQLTSLPAAGLLLQLSTRRESWSPLNQSLKQWDSHWRACDCNKFLVKIYKFQFFIKIVKNKNQNRIISEMETIPSINLK